MRLNFWFCSQCGSRYCRDHFILLPHEEVRRRVGTPLANPLLNGDGVGLCLGCDSARANREKWFREWVNFERGDTVVFSTGRGEYYIEERFQLGATVETGGRLLHVFRPLDPLVYVLNFTIQQPGGPLEVLDPCPPQLLAMAQGTAAFEDGRFRWSSEDIVARAGELVACADHKPLSVLERWLLAFVRDVRSSCARDFQLEWRELCASARFQNASRVKAHLDRCSAIAESAGAERPARILQSLVCLADGFLAAQGIERKPGADAAHLLRSALALWPENSWAAALHASLARSSAPIRQFLAIGAAHDPLWTAVLNRAASLLDDEDAGLPVVTAEYQLVDDAPRARGSFKQVFEARGTRDAAHVAILTPRDDNGSEEARSAFGNELAILEHLSNGHTSRAAGRSRTIPRLLASGVAQIGSVRRRAYVTEYMPRGDLAALLREGELVLGDALLIAQELSDGLAQLHAAGVVHGDLKPNNVVVTEYDPPMPCFCDFGSARILRDGAIDAPAGATNDGYAAPEVVRTGRASPQSDVFALGRTLDQVFERLLDASRLDGNHIDPAVAADIRRTIDRCKADAPHARPHAEQVLQDWRRVSKHAVAADETRLTRAARLANEERASWVESAAVAANANEHEVLRRALHQVAIVREDHANPTGAAIELVNVPRVVLQERVLLPWRAVLRDRKVTAAKLRREAGATGNDLLRQLADFVYTGASDVSIMCVARMLSPEFEKEAAELQAFFATICPRDATLEANLMDLAELRNALVHGSHPRSPAARARIQRWLRPEVRGVQVDFDGLERLVGSVREVYLWLHGGPRG